MTFRRLAEQDHYQVLEVPYDASYEEIQSAYEAAKDLYSHDALVSGSILSEQERRRTFDRISEAYQTLIAEESRRLYDARLGLGTRGRSPVSVSAKVTTSPAVLDKSTTRLEEREPEPEVPVEGAVDAGCAEPRQCPVQLRPGEEATGEFLRKAREAMGLELQAISEETKIGQTMLEYIETERLDRLPAPVYLKNFTRQFAACLGLDGDRVASTYVERVRRLSV